MRGMKKRVWKGWAVMTRPYHDRILSYYPADIYPTKAAAKSKSEYMEGIDGTLRDVVKVKVVRIC